MFQYRQKKILQNEYFSYSQRGFQPVYPILYVFSVPIPFNNGTKWRQTKNPTQHNVKAIETLPQKKEVCSKIAANFTTLYSDTEKTIHLKRGKSE